MFLKYYGLREQPFGVTPDPGYLYFGASHREALASMFYGIETGCGFLSLIATPGMGKTTLLLRLLEQLRGTSQTVFLFQTQCNSREFMRYLLSDLGIDTRRQDLAQMHQALNGFLLSNARNGWRFVLIIDEAQNLRNSVLETVRLLSDFEAPPRKLLQIVLSGQPELGDRLSKPDLMQLRQRISIVSRLQPLSIFETTAYVDHRLRVAGYAGPPLFEPEAISQIATHSAGIPRNINNICFNALTLACAKRQKRVDIATIHEVLRDLNIAPWSCGNDTGESFSIDSPPSSDAVRSDGQPFPEELYSPANQPSVQKEANAHIRGGSEAASSSRVVGGASVVEGFAPALDASTILVEPALSSEDPVPNGLQRAAMVDSLDDEEQTVFARDSADREENSAVFSGIMDGPDASTSAESEHLGLAHDRSEAAAEPEQPRAFVESGENYALLSVASLNSPPNASFNPSGVSGFIPARRMAMAACVSIAFGCVVLLLWHTPRINNDSRISFVSASQRSAVPMLPPRIDAGSAVVTKIASKLGEGITAEPLRSVAIIKHKRVANVTSDVFGELNAHPSFTPPKIAAFSEPIPYMSTNVAWDINSAIFAAGTQSVAKPEMSFQSPDHSGTALVQAQRAQYPRLVFSVSPAYPNSAKRMGVTGNVVVDVKINESGDISKMKVVSGSTILRKAALAALQQWRYEPAKPGVRRSAIDTLVTVRFQE